MGNSLGGWQRPFMVRARAVGGVLTGFREEVRQVQPAGIGRRAAAFGRCAPDLEHDVARESGA